MEAARAYSIELAPLVPFSITLASSKPIKSAEHRKHNDPADYRATFGYTLWGKVDLDLHHPSAGVEDVTQRVEAKSAYLMTGQAVSLREHFVLHPLTDEGRCVLIVRFIDASQLEEMTQAMEMAGQA